MRPLLKKSTFSQSNFTQELKTFCGDESNKAEENKNDQEERASIWSIGFSPKPENDPNFLEFVPHQDLVPNHVKIKKIVSTTKTTFILTKNGDLYSCGGFSMTLGRQVDKIGEEYTPKKIIFSEKISSIAVGKNHVITIDINNNIYAWGDNQKGQVITSNLINFYKVKLGFGDSNLKESYNPIQIKFDHQNEKITSIFAGQNSSFFVTEKGNIYACGDNTGGVLGIRSLKRIFRPTLLDKIIWEKTKDLVIAEGKNKDEMFYYINENGEENKDDSPPNKKLRNNITILESEKKEQNKKIINLEKKIVDLEEKIFGKNITKNAEIAGVIKEDEILFKISEELSKINQEISALEAKSTELYEETNIIKIELEAIKGQLVFLEKKDDDMKIKNNSINKKMKKIMNENGLNSKEYEEIERKKNLLELASKSTKSMGENIFKKSNELDELAKNKVIERNKLELKIEEARSKALFYSQLMAERKQTILSQFFNNTETVDKILIKFYDILPQLKKTDIKYLASQKQITDKIIGLPILIQESNELIGSIQRNLHFFKNRSNDTNYDFNSFIVSIYEDNAKQRLIVNELTNALLSYTSNQIDQFYSNFKFINAKTDLDLELPIKKSANKEKNIHDAKK